MRTLASLLLFGSVVLMCSRVFIPWIQVPTEQALAQTRLTFRSRVRLQRTNVYAIGVLLILGIVGGWVSTPLELFVIALAMLILLLPVRYTLTDEGVMLGRTPLRRWSEFEGLERKHGRVRLLASGDWRNVDIWISDTAENLGTIALMQRLVREGARGVKHQNVKIERGYKKPQPQARQAARTGRT